MECFRYTGKCGIYIAKHLTQENYRSHNFWQSVYMLTVENLASLIKKSLIIECLSTIATFKVDNLVVGKFFIIDQANLLKRH